VKLHAESAAVDLRRAQLDQFKQLFIDAGLCRGMAQCEDNVADVGRQCLEIFLFASGCDICHYPVI
jgi:hypothetical protein